jgi:hypothetical protein
MRLVRITRHLFFFEVSIPVEGLKIFGFVIEVFRYVSGKILHSSMEVPTNC